MDEIPEPYRAFMRWSDGTISEVQWAFTDQNAPVNELPTPYRSGHLTPDWPHDMGCVGEIPERYIRRATITRPSWVVTCCRLGDDVWWTDGWPDGTPGVSLVDGWASGCGGLMPVISVGLEMPAEFTVANSPITGSGTFIVTKEPQAANTFYAGPSSGADAVPGFRPIDTADLGSGVASSFTFLRGDKQWTSIPPGTIVEAGDNVSVLEFPAGTYIVSVSTYPASDIVGTLPAAQVGAGYPYADLTGAPAAVSVVGGTNMTVVESPTGTFTVSLPSYPAADITGTLPASQVGPGYDIADTTGLLDPARLDTGSIPTGTTLPPASLESGAIPAGTTIPYGQVTGAPAAGASLKNDHYTPTTTSITYSTVFDKTISSGWIGAMYVMNNTNVVGLNVRVTFYDMKGSNYTNSLTVGFFSRVSFDWLLPGGGAFGLPASYPPYTRIVVEVASNGAATTNADIYNTYME